MAEIKSKLQIEEEIAAARARLSSNIEGLIGQGHPKAIAARGIDQAKTFAEAEFVNAKAQVIDDDGAWRYDRLAIIGGAIAGVIGLLVAIRAIVRKARKS